MRSPKVSSSRFSLEGRENALREMKILAKSAKDPSQRQRFANHVEELKMLWKENTSPLTIFLLCFPAIAVSCIAIAVSNGWISQVPSTPRSSLLLRLMPPSISLMLLGRVGIFLSIVALFASRLVVLQTLYCFAGLAVSWVSILLGPSFSLLPAAFLVLAASASSLHAHAHKMYLESFFTPLSSAGILLMSGISYALDASAGSPLHVEEFVEQPWSWSTVLRIVQVAWSSHQLLTVLLIGLLISTLCILTGISFPRLFPEWFMNISYMALLISALMIGPAVFFWNSRSFVSLFWLLMKLFAPVLIGYVSEYHLRVFLSEEKISLRFLVVVLVVGSVALISTVCDDFIFSFVKKSFL